MKMEKVSIDFKVEKTFIDPIMSLTTQIYRIVFIHWHDLNVRFIIALQNTMFQMAYLK